MNMSLTSNSCPIFVCVGGEDIWNLVSSQRRSVQTLLIYYILHVSQFTKTNHSF